MAEARIPPHSIEAERAVLGALLTSDTDVYDSISGIVKTQDFYRDANRVILKPSQRLYIVINERIWYF